MLSHGCDEIKSPSLYVWFLDLYVWFIDWDGGAAVPELNQSLLLLSSLLPPRRPARPPLGPPRRSPLA